MVCGVAGGDGADIVRDGDADARAAPRVCLWRYGAVPDCIGDAGRMRREKQRGRRWLHADDYREV